MICSEKDLEVYKKIKEYILDGKVKPYDELLQNELKTHTDKNNENFSNYLNALCSDYCVGKSYLLSRYVIQFLDKEKYHLMNGTYDAFDDKCDAYWIENDDYVYDVVFTGKWPKKLYYDTFLPNKVNKIDLKNDKPLKRIEQGNIHTNNIEDNGFRYVDWYSYMKNNTIGFHSHYEALHCLEYPNNDESIKLCKRK